MKRILVALLALGVCAVNANDFKSQLNGKRLVMQDAACAGISLKKNSGLLGERGNFPPCNVSMPARLRWLDNSTFVMVETERNDDTSPPRTSLYKVKSIKGNKAVLTEIWLGWNNFPDDDTTYTIVK